MRESSDTWTVWTPIGDCGEEIGGGLGFVPGSNRAELLDAEMTMMEVEIDPGRQPLADPRPLGLHPSLSG